MSRPRFLADQNLDEDIVRGLLRREPAAEFLLARDLGVERIPDDALLQFAADRKLIVVSHDVNTLPHAGFERVRVGLPIPGLFLIIRNKPIGPSIEGLALIWDVSEAEEWEGQIIYVPI